MIAVLGAEVAALRDGRVEDAELLRKARESADAEPKSTAQNSKEPAATELDAVAVGVEDDVNDEEAARPASVGAPAEMDSSTGTHSSAGTHAPTGARASTDSDAPSTDPDA
jgi:hypothetical protein